MSTQKDLTNVSISVGYKQLLHTGETDGLATTERVVVDGDGTNSIFSLGTSSASFLGPLTIGSSIFNDGGFNPGTGSGLGSWSATSEYQAGDIVNLSGDLYTATQASTNKSPATEAAYWELTIAALPMTTITDPAAGALNTAMVDSYSGVVVTLTAAKSCTLGTPTATTAGKTFTVVNKSTNGYNITADTIEIEPGFAQRYLWDGAAWVRVSSIDANDITFNPAASYLTDTNVQSAFDTVFTSDGILFTKGSQNYLFTDNGTGLVLQGQTPATPSAFSLFNKDGDGTDDIYFELFGVGTPGSVTNREKLQVYYDKAGQFIIRSEADGTGTLRPIQIATEGNTNQLYLATDGKVGIGTATPTGQFEVVVDDANNNGLATLQQFIHSTTGTAGDGIGIRATYESEDDSGSAATMGYIDFFLSDVSDGAEKSQIDFTTRNASIGKSVSIHHDAMLDLYGGTITILAGADDGAKTRTNSTNKLFRLGIPNYLNASVPVNLITAFSSSADSELYLGGGGGAESFATTRTRIWAADNVATPTGTEVARFEGGAAKALMMGLGNSSLKTLQSIYSGLQLGGNTTLISQTAVSGTNLVELTQNVYRNASGSDLHISTGTASKYRQISGTHIFSVGASRTADVAYAQVDALAIANDGSSTFGGKVGIGTALGESLLTLSMAATTGYTQADEYLHIGGTEAGVGTTRLIGLGYNLAARTYTPAYIGYIETSSTGDTKGDLIFGTRDVTTNTQATERLRIASDGSSTFGGALSIPATSRLYFDGALGGVFISESSNDVMNFAVAGATATQISTTGTQFFNTVGIGVAPDAAYSLKTAGSASIDGDLTVTGILRDTKVSYTEGFAGSVGVIENVYSQIALKMFGKLFDKNVLLRGGDDLTVSANQHIGTTQLPAGETCLIYAFIESSADAFSYPQIQADTSNFGVDKSYPLGTTGFISTIQDSVAPSGAFAGTVKINRASGSIVGDFGIFNLTSLGTLTANHVTMLTSMATLNDWTITGTLSTSTRWDAIATWLAGHTDEFFAIVIDKHVSGMEGAIASEVNNYGGNLASRRPSALASLDSNGTLTALDNGFRFTANAAATYIDVTYKWYLLPNTQYTMQCNKSNVGASDVSVVVTGGTGGGVLADGTPRTVVTGALGTVQITSYCSLASAATVGDYVEVTNIQLNQGSTANTYSEPLYSPFVLGSKSENDFRNGNGEEGVRFFNIGDAATTFTHDGTVYKILNTDNTGAYVTRTGFNNLNRTFYINITDTTTSALELRVYVSEQMDNETQLTADGWTWNAGGYYYGDFTVGEHATYFENITDLLFSVTDSVDTDFVEFKWLQLIKGEYTLAELQAKPYVSYEPIDVLTCPTNDRTSTVSDTIEQDAQGRIMFTPYVKRNAGYTGYGSPEIDAALLNVSTALNGTGGGNRGFDGSFTGASATGFTGTDSTDQGAGFFPVTITEGLKYIFGLTTASTNSNILNIATYSGTNFATDEVEILEATPLIGGGTGVFEFVASANATHIGIRYSYSGGTIEAIVSNFFVNAFNIQQNLAPEPEDISEFVISGSLLQPFSIGQNHIVAEDGIFTEVSHSKGIDAIIEDVSSLSRNKLDKSDQHKEYPLSVTSTGGVAGSSNTVVLFSDITGFPDYIENAEILTSTLDINITGVVVYDNAIVITADATGTGAGDELCNLLIQSAEAKISHTIA